MVMDCYLGCMDKRYNILQTLAAVLKEAKQSIQYQFIPREIILRSSLDWSEIYTHLSELEKEGMVEMVTADGLKFSVTQKGIDKANEMEAEAGSEILLALKKTKLS
jgi:predicted transcriptional regulator